MTILRRLPSRVRRARLLATAGSLILAAPLIGGCGSSSHATTTSVGTTRVGPEPIFEAGAQLGSDPAAALTTLRRLGVARVKVFLPWNSVAPDATARKPPHFDATNPAAYPAAGWARYDAIVREAVQHGIRLDLTLSNPPVWAAGADAPDAALHPWWKPSPKAFEAFVRAVATRYSGSYQPPGAPSPLPPVGRVAPHRHRRARPGDVGSHRPQPLRQH